MKSRISKESKLWIAVIFGITVVSAALGNYFTNRNIAGGIIAVLILLAIPFMIELLRKKDPVTYYALDLNTLRKINLKEVFAWAITIFTVVSILDYFVFDLTNKILNYDNADINVGDTSIALARTSYFYLIVIIAFSGTLLEELWFRGLIQHKVNNIKALKKINPHFGIILQSVLFGLIHFVPVYYGTELDIKIKIWIFVYPTIIGIVIGYLNDKYKSLWPGWIMHYTNNILAVFLLKIILN